ncbi:thioredoxin family protein [Enterococcus sp. RIT-PI-f]|uniref:thioredoxin family protein n=1 Tax=Enterococcus sp. RIT-PI-f TaxID=1690244 RepID=UPI003565E639
MKKLLVSTFVIAIIGILGFSMYNNITHEELFYENTNFNKIPQLIKSKEKVIVFVVQDGCSICKLVEPIVNEYAKNNQGVVYSIIENKEKDFSTQSVKYNIENTPTMIYYQNGREIYRTTSGFTEDEFKQTVKKVDF